MGNRSRARGGTPAAESAEGERGSVGDPGQDSAPCRPEARASPGIRGSALTHPETEHIGFATEPVRPGAVRYPLSAPGSLEPVHPRPDPGGGLPRRGHPCPWRAHRGPHRGVHGRSPLDKYVVGRPETDPDVRQSGTAEWGPAGAPVPRPEDALAPRPFEVQPEEGGPARSGRRAAGATPAPRSGDPHTVSALPPGEARTRGHPPKSANAPTTVPPSAVRANICCSAPCDGVTVRNGPRPSSPGSRHRNAASPDPDQRSPSRTASASRTWAVRPPKASRTTRTYRRAASHCSSSIPSRTPGIVLTPYPV